jgi:hypothetical protein
LAAAGNAPATPEPKNYPNLLMIIADRHGNGVTQPSSSHYSEYQMYNLFADPHQLLNLAGRHDNPKLVHYNGDQPLPEAASYLRERLIARMVEAGETAPQIEKATLYP